MKTPNEIKQEAIPDRVKEDARKYFDENFTMGNYSNIEKELFMIGYMKGHLEGRKESFRELKESEATHA